MLHADAEAQLQGYQILNWRSSSTDFVYKSMLLQQLILEYHILEFVLQKFKIVIFASEYWVSKFVVLDIHDEFVGMDHEEENRNA